MDIFNESDLDNIDIERTISNMSDVSEVGDQTCLSLSSASPRKAHLYQQIRAYKREIAILKLQLHEAKKPKEDINSFDALVDKYFPQQTSNFLKTQVRLFQVQKYIKIWQINLKYFACLVVQL